MSSGTAEAVYVTMVQGLEYLADYFEHQNIEIMLSKIHMKSVTTFMVGCIFG